MRPIFNRPRLAKASIALLLAGAPLVAGAAGAADGPDPGEAPRAGGCAAYRDNNRYPLRPCDKGVGVLLLQVALRRVVAPNLAEDGYFGVQTERALIDYERTWGLPVDGIVDAHTWSSLTWQYVDREDTDGSGIVDPWELAGALPQQPRPPQPGRCAGYRADYAYPMQLCGRGEGIRVAQQGLRIVQPDLVADGFFGPATYAAVFEFQQTTGLPVTGEIDEPTWVMLTGGGAAGHDADGDGIVDPWELGG